MLDRTKFKHVFQLQVRNHEVDWQGVVHNANYLLYFEVGRFEYLKNLDIKMDLNTVRNETKVVLVRNEVDYKSPARFDDLLNIYTRISYFRKYEFCFRRDY
ncbi:MAG TPA: YbgC/FadM family acyl-CoA thioesterase [Bacteroidota bacterium]|nr:YbgC/FadM family acyl-CoA thioesterase [Bacteroidota bacterium]